MRIIGWIAAAALAWIPMAGDAGATADLPALRTADRVSIEIDTLHSFASGVAPAALRVRVFLPPGYRNAAATRYPTLYVNDGQDMEAVGLQQTLRDLYARNEIRPLIVIAIDMPPDRMGAYGLSDRSAKHGLVAQTRYGPVGERAHAYSEWVAKILVPLIDARYRTRAAADGRAALGWSLGALNAFNLGWQYPERFARVGAFSPSLWLSADRGDADAVQRTRLPLRMVEDSSPRTGLKLFFAVGTAEETDDRDGDGINDALDDTRDLVDGWRSGRRVAVKGLRQLGYVVNMNYAAHHTPDDVVLYVLDGGRHEQASWARMLPVFLRWAYATPAIAPAATAPL